MLTSKVKCSPFLGGNHIQQRIILKVIMIETRCLQFLNSQVIILSKHGMLNVYTHYGAYKLNFDQN